MSARETINTTSLKSKSMIPVLLPRGPRRDLLMKKLRKSSPRNVLKKNNLARSSKNVPVTKQNEKGGKHGRKQAPLQCRKPKDIKNVAVKSRLSVVPELSEQSGQDLSNASKSRCEISSPIMKIEQYQVLLPSGMTQPMQVNIIHSEYKLLEEHRDKSFAPSLNINVKCDKSVQTTCSEDFKDAHRAIELYNHHISELMELNRAHLREFQTFIAKFIINNDM